jgi:glyoxylate/hydroxypyruvate reductase A
MSILALSTSPIVDAQIAALRRLAPNETIVTEPDEVAPEDVEVLYAFKLMPGIASRFPRLRFIACAGAGVDDLLAHADLPRDVPLTRTNDPAQAARMAQYVALTVLRWHRELPRFEAQQRERTWARRLPEREERWAVGLMGYGGLGRAVAAALQPLGYPVRAWTRTPREGRCVECYAGDDGLDAFLAGTRVLVCLLPLTSATRGILSASVFARLPRGAHVVNVSRGALLNEADLVAALDRGHLAAAALDVFAHEPLPPDSPLWTDGRILVTPHVAAFPQPETAARHLLDNLARARRGEPLHDVVDRDRGY